MPGRICKHEGCGRLVTGRGMCQNHYEYWRRHNPESITMRVRDNAVLEAMPGTVHQLAERVGICLASARRAIESLNVKGIERQAFITDYVPPASKGKRWEPIYAMGKKPDLKLTAERRREHMLMLQRAGHARRTGRQAPPAARASWIDALGAIAA